MREIRFVWAAVLAVTMGGVWAADAEARLCAKPRLGAAVMQRGKCNKSEAPVELDTVVLCATKSGKVSLFRQECPRSQTRVVGLAAAAECPRPYLLASPPAGLTLKKQPGEKIELEPRPAPKVNVEPFVFDGFSFSK